MWPDGYAEGTPEYWEKYEGFNPLQGILMWPVKNQTFPKNGSIPFQSLTGNSDVASGVSHF